ncbi:DUF2251 domain-containing protein [Rufibacter quisquiliarum]|uniref:DUF2251 domain-containing protein n=1 Tax=Rufibacter quisquiliarum TaxID=1549639 RepID=A0A839GWP4_9BACT|nr:DUF2251 domain-containing protein [Rufibacter quisquiliarum]MBA9079875.1 hypothetical protein [Rufibacter quisquiliarum]
MKMYIYEEEIFYPGKDIFIDSTADNENAVVFEDNEETGYFYAVERSDGLEILDALHIYNVKNIVDKDKPSTLKILWSEDESIALLSINDYYHAHFDFKSKAGYCRTGFPENGSWAKVKERELTDDLLESISKK